MSSIENRPGPSTKKKILVASLLAVGAMGARYVPQRAAVRATDQHVASSALGENKVAVATPNTLFGSSIAATTPLADTSVDADIAHYHLSAGSLIEEAGASPQLRSLELIDGQPLALVSENSPAVTATASASLSPVPEPGVAGVILLAAAPMAILRRRRTQH